MMRLFLFVSAVCTLCSSVVFAQESRSIAAVNAPLAYFAGELVGTEIDVIYPIPEGVDPAYWEPTNNEVLQFQQADLILLNGAGYAEWVKTTTLPRARLVDTTRAATDRLIPAEEEGVVHTHGPEGSHAHSTDYAITTWLDPVLANAQLDSVADAIIVRWPDMEDKVSQRLAALKEELADTDEALSEYFAGLQGRQVLASHPVYQYLDRAYFGGLISLHWEPDVFPDERAWTSFSDLIDRDRAPLMVWEDTPLPETAERLADLGVEVIVLRPMGNAVGDEPLFRSIGAQVQ